MASDHDRIVRLEERLAASIRLRAEHDLAVKEQFAAVAEVERERAAALAKALELAREGRLSPEDEARIRVLEAGAERDAGGSKTWATVLSVILAVVAVGGLIIAFATR